MSRKNNVVMKSADTINAKEAECYLEFNGHRYNCFHFKDLEVTLEIKKAEINVLGKSMTGHKMVSQSGKFKGSKLVVESEMIKALKEFKETGAAPTYSIQIINEDPTSAAGRQEIWLYECMSDSISLAKFNAEGESLEADVEGTFDDWDIPQAFTPLPGMQIK